VDECAGDHSLLLWRWGSRETERSGEKRVRAYVFYIEVREIQMVNGIEIYWRIEQ